MDLSLMEKELKNENLESICTSYLEKQFATKIDSFSSQYGQENSIFYTAANLAKPSSYCKYPAYGDFQECFLLVNL